MVCIDCQHFLDRIGIFSTTRSQSHWRNFEQISGINDTIECAFCALLQSAIQSVLLHLPVFSDVALQWRPVAFIDGTEHPMEKRYATPCKTLSKGYDLFDKIVFMSCEEMEQYLKPITNATRREPLSDQVQLNTVNVQRTTVSSRILIQCENSFAPPVFLRGSTYILWVMLRDVRSTKFSQPLMPLCPNFTLAKLSGMQQVSDSEH